RWRSMSSTEASPSRLLNYFFFSSRRRHTRFSRDWSSDVCSSDLYRERILTQIYQPDFVCFEKIIVELKAVSILTDEHRAQLLNRSEERRVGKECRCR